MIIIKQKPKYGFVSESEENHMIRIVKKALQEEDIQADVESDLVNEVTE